MRGWRRFLQAAVAIGVGAGAMGCAKKPQSDLLFVYSGDCQGYLEPCG